MNKKEEIILIVIVFILSISFIGILFVNNLIYPIALKNKYITPLTIIGGIGGAISLILFYHRNKIMYEQIEKQYTMFIGSKEFDNFLEATKLLTSKDSTIEAKISAIYLLYDIAKTHSENLDRVIQILNKQLIPLIKCLENNCDSRKVKKELSSKKIITYPKKVIREINYTYNEILKVNPNDLGVKKIIKEWQYKGNDKEKLVAVTLKVLKKIIIEIVLKQDKYIDLSNVVLFDIDTYYDKNIKFNSNKNPTENIIFLNCKLNNLDFSNTIYYYASFINCNLTGSKFKNANLWGSDFISCNLKEVNFEETECEGVSFEKCVNLTKEQLDNMKFEFKKEIKEKSNKLDDAYIDGKIDTELVVKWCQDNFYPIFIDEKSKANIGYITHFDSEEEYQKLIKLKQYIRYLMD